MIEKRVPMAGDMKKVATQESADKTATIEGDDWSLTIPKGIFDKVGPGVVKAFMESAMTMMRADTQYPPPVEEGQ